MCCDATHVVRRGCSRSYLACCTCISAWQKCPIEPLGKESGWLLWRATELRTPFFFRPLNGHIFWNRAEKKWYTFLCTNGRFRYILYSFLLSYLSPYPMCRTPKGLCFWGEAPSMSSVPTLLQHSIGFTWTWPKFCGTLRKPSKRWGLQ